MTLTFQCYAYRSRESWEAICVNLDIAGFGGSAREVVASLEASIQMHLEGVSELPAEEQGRLLARPAPWYVRAKLAMIMWLAPFRGDSDRAFRFTVESHLPRLPLPEQPSRQAGLAPDGR